MILIADIEKIPVMSHATARALRERNLATVQKGIVENELQTLYAATVDNLYLRVRVSEPLDKVASHLNQLLDAGNYKIEIDGKVFLPSKMTDEEREAALDARDLKRAEDDLARSDATKRLERLKSGTNQGPGTFEL